MQIQAPMHVCHAYTQHLVAPPEQVFPLLCPVREYEWVQGWDPPLVLSNSGIAEPGCIFLTVDGGSESIWVVTRYEPEQFRIAFLKVTPGQSVGEIAIQLQPAGEHGTAAGVTYAYTALSATGEQALSQFTPQAYDAFMRKWEQALNYFLKTGQKLPAD